MGSKKDRKDEDVITLLEALKTSMCSMRESMEMLVGIWRTYSDEASHRQYLLKRR
jgi:hypothetical protein